VLGAALGAALASGRDKLTLIISPDIASFGSWIEQLVAESSGKEGKGIVPIDLEPVGKPESYGDDRFFVYIRSAGADAKQDAAVTALERAGQPVVRIAVDRREALGREIYRWEMATAIACASMGVNPFDEPNVTEAKVATSALLAQARGRGQAARRARRHLRGERRRAHPRAPGVRDAQRLRRVLRLLPAHAGRDAALTRMRVACRDRSRNATTVGYGPRFLHSTGQLHKGGPNTGVFLQLTADTKDDLPVPARATRFATLRDAQALGDLQVLKRRGRARCASTWAPTWMRLSRRSPSDRRWAKRGARASRLSALAHLANGRSVALGARPPLRAAAHLASAPLASRALALPREGCVDSCATLRRKALRGADVRAGREASARARAGFRSVRDNASHVRARVFFSVREADARFARTSARDRDAQPAARGAGGGACARAGGDGDLRRVGRSRAPQAAARRSTA
jgi:hypothetical protein